MGAWCSQFLGEGDIDAESKPSGGSVGGPNKPKISGKENEKKGDTANTTGSEPKSHGQNGRPSQEPVIDEEKSPESKIPKAQFTRGDVKTSYRFGKQLAKTNFGMVNLANDSKNGEPVVVKTSEIEGRCIEDPEEEVRMLQYLQSLWISRKRKQDPASSSTSCYEAAHPNIVQLKGAFHQPPCYWTVLEYCGGGDAFDYVVEHKSIDEDVVRTLWRDLLVATHFMHTNGICHLDISLENALLSADGKKMKLCDLGAARELVYVDGKLQPYSPHDGCPGMHF
uniref:Protein kinase domain-containing protein n=1 Tax=Lotharella globosa TaxID=91324 RepID=A0A7S3YHR5_9EUKA